ncbi:MAG TPA: DUF3226 domain-containing protein [Nostocaceae cyanobacterium]|nr:DUF3226 domain-containing protein [Nostocaceae cyanobacterium]
MYENKGNSGVISKSKLLIGEGKDEVLFFNKLLEHLNINDIQVEPYNGTDKLGNYLRNLSLRPGYRELISLGVIRDADLSANNTFDSVCGMLKNAKLPVPRFPKQIVGENLKVSVLILPDYPANESENNLEPRMLETLCLDAIRTNSEMQCVENYFNFLADNVGIKCKPKDMAKARLQVWLASQERPDLRLGEAAQKGYFNWDSPAFDGLKEFLQSL